MASWQTFPGMRTWRRMDSVARFALYFRYSMHLGMVGFLILSIVLPATTSDFIRGRDLVTGWPLAIATLVVIAVALPAFVAVEFEPDFNVRPRPPAGPWRRATAIASAAAAAMGFALLFIPGQWGGAGIVLVPAAMFIVAFAVVPWVPRRHAVLALITVAATVVSLPIAFMVLLLGITTMLSAWSVHIVKEADRARQLEAALKVSEERLRFAQELHDTLGQHLAAMSLKAEVARALAARNDDRLDTQLVELQALTKTSMAQMREVVEGYRTINLATEIEGARSLLTSAGIAVTVTGDSFDVPESYRELAAWFLREAATNVLKHSTATHVSIAVAPRRVTLINDGVTEAAGPPGGMGTLRRRAESTGSSISTHREGAHFRAELKLP